jgi:hypothetical protein
MLECIFTIDYEIYGNGEGSLKELVLEPAQQLKTIFDEAGAKFVLFVETAELERIEAARTDPAIGNVARQIREFHDDGFEIGLHLHPQWCNAQYHQGKWELDYDEYNLCTLPESRISEIVGHSIAYLRRVLDAPDFTPLSFRAGNWLFQPTATAARVLAQHGIKIDSSVFKGGRQHKHKLDYRRASDNGYYWKFSNDVTTPDSAGPLLEIPIYTTMVPFWKMATPKRIRLQSKAGSTTRSPRDRVNRLLDLIRFRQPLKFDFCRMTLDELVSTAEGASREDQSSPHVFKPIVAIGHTKDLIDFRTIKGFLSYLREKNICTSTFDRRCASAHLDRSRSLGAAGERMVTTIL